MAESNDASNEVPLQELKTTDGHKAGSVFAAWLAPKEGLAVLTAGAGDGVLSERQIRPTQKEEFRTQLDRECKHAKGIHCLDISPDRTKAAVAINRNNIQVRAVVTGGWCMSSSCGRCTPSHIMQNTVRSLINGIWHSAVSQQMQRQPVRTAYA
jgi:hypothetical protein